MMLWRNRWVRSSRGDEKISSGVPSSRITPVVQEPDPVRDVAREPHLVGRDHHRHPAGRELADHVQDLGDELGVERARDLVEQHHVGLHRERPHDRHPLLLPAREPVRVVVALVREPEPFEQLRSRAPRPRPSTVPSASIGPSVTLRSTVMCGNRLKAWNTIPTRWRIRFTSTPRAVISSPSMKIRPPFDRLEQVDAAEQGRLARTRRADQARRPRARRPRGRCP